MPFPDYSEQEIKNVKYAEVHVSFPPLMFWFSDIQEYSKPTLLYNN